MCFLLQPDKRWRSAAFLFSFLFMLSAVSIFYAEVLQAPVHRQWWRLPSRHPQELDTFDREFLPETPSATLRNIFFVETSCALLDVPSLSSHVHLTTRFGGLRMNARVACALEAAARTHPQRPVYLVHTCPVDFAAMWATAPNFTLQVLSMPNVRVWPVRMSQLFAGTSLESLLTGQKLGKSPWPVVHASDILRLFLLWRFGGTYLDTDVLLLRSLGDMQNFACAEEPNSLNNAVLDFARDSTGLEVAKACVEGLSGYRPEKWAYNGPQLVSRVMKKRCGTDEFTRNVPPERCGGFHLLQISDFYPVHWSKWDQYFKEEGAERTMISISKSIGVHVWSSRSSQLPNISLSSNQPFIQVVHRVCPDVVSTLGDTI